MNLIILTRFSNINIIRKKRGSISLARDRRRIDSWHLWRNLKKHSKTILITIRLSRYHLFTMKKALTETQTLRAGCSKAEPKIFAPPQTLSPGAQDGQNLISWRWLLPSPTVWWRSMHAISSYRGNRPTNKQINKPTNTNTQTNAHTQTGPITIHCAAKLRAQCNKWMSELDWGRQIMLLRLCNSVDMPTYIFI